MDMRNITEISASRLRKARRVVIKLGTSIVTDGDDTAPVNHIEVLVKSVAALKSEGRQIVLISSGAIGLGRISY